MKRDGESSKLLWRRNQVKQNANHISRFKGPLQSNTLERKAYGIMYRGRMGTKGGWTVVFHHNPRYEEGGSMWGRAVTMDKDFKNLRVEHSMFPLTSVGKKL